MKTNKKGFTLIELLVVIAIIGLLSTLSVIALNAARARARDAKRISDVQQIQTALEMYYNDTGAYPTAASVTPNQAIYSPSSVYMQVIPTPPSPKDGNCPTFDNATGYTYTATAISGSAVGSYTIEYCLGADVNGVAGNVMETATPAGIK